MQGKTINGYTLQRLLGKGGMAEVWYAENTLGKNAAVKFLKKELCANPDIVTRFRNEAQVMVKLNHPNIRQVYDYAELDGQPAIIMEYLEGDDLKTRMKRGECFGEQQLEKWWNQMADALNYTHKKGVVHRDIKPSNIFVDTEGNVRLLDFGIAKIKEAASGTQTGQKMGTLVYMSPEQIKDSKHIDYRTDVYSLAVTFVNLIQGRAPYDDTQISEWEIMNKIVSQPLDMSGVPEKWKSFLQPFLDKEPGHRPSLKPFTSRSVPVSGDETVIDVLERNESNPNGPTVLERFPNIKFVQNSKRKFIPFWLWVFFAAIFLYSFGSLLIVFLILYPKRRKQLKELFIEETKGRFVLVSDLYKVGLYHKFTMTILVPIEYDRIEKVFSNFFVVEKNGRKGVYKRKENIIPVEYDKIQWNSTNNIFFAEKKGQKILFDINGKKLNYE